MKKFTTQEIRGLFNRVMIEEISFSEMVEVINNRISEAEEIPDELKQGDLAIFWNFSKRTAMIGEYNYLIGRVSYPHKDKMGNVWVNAIKFQSKEQFEQLIKGEI